MESARARTLDAPPAAQYTGQYVMLDYTNATTDAMSWLASLSPLSEQDLCDLCLALRTRGHGQRFRCTLDASLLLLEAQGADTPLLLLSERAARNLLDHLVSGYLRDKPRGLRAWHAREYGGQE